MELRRPWLALALAFLWGAFGALHPDALRSPASADANTSPPWAILAPRRAVMDRGPLPSESSQHAADRGVLVAVAIPEGDAAACVLARPGSATPPTAGERLRPRSRGPPIPRET